MRLGWDVRLLILAFCAANATLVAQTTRPAWPADAKDKPLPSRIGHVAVALPDRDGRSQLRSHEKRAGGDVAIAARHQIQKLCNSDAVFSGAESGRVHPEPAEQRSPVPE